MKNRQKLEHKLSFAKIFGINLRETKLFKNKAKLFSCVYIDSVVDS